MISNCRLSSFLNLNFVVMIHIITIISKLLTQCDLAFYVARFRSDSKHLACLKNRYQTLKSDSPSFCDPATKNHSSLNLIARQKMYLRRFFARSFSINCLLEMNYPSCPYLRSLSCSLPTAMIIEQDSFYSEKCVALSP